jgi:UPF0716 family protein affecting phage T7 exclusion
MTKSILKSAAIGILIGAAVFFIPGVLIGLFILFALVRLLAGRRMGYRYGGSRFAFADKVRGMSEEEYNQFKTSFSARCTDKSQPAVH